MNMDSSNPIIYYLLNSVARCKIISKQIKKKKKFSKVRSRSFIDSLKLCPEDAADYTGLDLKKKKKRGKKVMLIRRKGPFSSQPASS